MIEIKNISKSFGELNALKNVSCAVKDGSIFGIVGSNGAGKSTLLRAITGVYDIDEGSVFYDSVELGNKQKNTPDLLFLSDDIFYESFETIDAMAKRYKAIYSNLDYSKYKKLLEIFNLNKKTKIEKLSKGMKKQAFLSIALACNTKYLLLDETLDGLDPMMRINAKKLIFDETAKRKMVTVITSHSLKELEDMCDNLSMLHEGEIILNGSIDEFKSDMIKIRCAFSETMEKEDFNGINLESYENSGKIYTLIAKGKEEQIKEKINELNPILLEVFPMTIEEVFVIKLKQLGYGDKLDRSVEI